MVGAAAEAAREVIGTAKMDQQSVAVIELEPASADAGRLDLVFPLPFRVARFNKLLNKIALPASDAIAQFPGERIFVCYYNGQDGSAFQKEIENLLGYSPKALIVGAPVESESPEVKGMRACFSERVLGQKSGGGGVQSLDWSAIATASDYHISIRSYGDSFVDGFKNIILWHVARARGKNGYLDIDPIFNFWNQ